VIVAVLAGGRARRMGGAKVTAALAGRPLLAWPLAAAAAAGLAAAVVAKPSTRLPPGLGVPVWLEPETPVHPLAGIVCALEREPEILVLGADMPFVTPAILRALAALDAPAAARTPAGWEPLLARYDARAVPALRSALAREASLRATVAALEPLPLDVPGDLVRSVNDPGALQAAEAALA
jgi:molybdopterin-guanine dinucleotide biosynthesis protein A